MKAPPTIFIWDILPLLQTVQMPHRFMVPYNFIFILLIALTYERYISKSAHSKIFTQSLLFSLFLSTILTVNLISKFDLAEQQAPLLTKLMDKKIVTSEHIPNNKHYEIYYKDLINHEKIPLHKITKGTTDISPIEDPNALISLNIDAKTPATLQLRQFHFTGRAVLKNQTDITPESNIRDVSPYGHTEIDIPLGQYTLQLIQKRLPEEKTGASITYISLLIYISLLLIYANIRRKAKRELI